MTMHGGENVDRILASGGTGVGTDLCAILQKPAQPTEQSAVPGPDLSGEWVCGLPQAYQPKILRVRYV